MNNSQLVSVIMPLYNSERYVAAAIESVLAQTYTNWELLVVNDGSTDRSVEIVTEYTQKDSRIHLLNNEHPNGMPSAPRNLGISKARGRYIAFLDSDDLWFSHKLTQQLPFFQDERVGVVYGDYEKMDENGRRNGRVVLAPMHATYKSLLAGNVIANLTGIYDSAKVGKVMIQHMHHEDYVMWLTILKQGFVAQNTGTIVGAYRIRRSSMSAQKMQAATWQWDVYRKSEHLSLLRSLYYMTCYAVKATAKYFI